MLDGSFRDWLVSRMNQKQEALTKLQKKSSGPGSKEDVHLRLSIESLLLNEQEILSQLDKE